jgi:asparagine synthase (glutamine-hydrolysing)
MCGITGFIDFRRQTSAEDLRATAKRMADTLRHRGPDSEGTWVDPAAGVALGHRRLAIIDLSPAGNQPMLSASRRFVIVYNGEVYNFNELRRDLEADGVEPAEIRGHSDTAVMLACFERWGIEASLPRFNGMFAFAAWDRQERTLHLSRDRMGEKPLYYGWAGNTFLFGSELKALRAHPGFEGEIDRDALSLYLRHNCVPAPYSIYRGVSKLPPGTSLSLPYAIDRNAAPTPYWTLQESVARGKAQPFSGGDHDALEQLDVLLKDAVRIRMLADVPLGSLLSGGIDSSTITALMQQQSSRAVKTFSIGLREKSYDEAQSAAAVARHLGTDHTELYISSAEALSVIPKLPTMYDEPFADSSQIPTFLVSQMARQHVTVGLSGDGGDELFGGYNRHVWSHRIRSATGWLPSGMRSTAAQAIRSIAPQSWDKVFHSFAAFLPAKARLRNPGLKLHKIADMLPAEDQESVYINHTSHWSDPTDVVIGAVEPPSAVRVDELVNSLDPTEQMMFLDAVTYLPDDILAKVDRASMAVSLESRVPFLDHRVVEFAWSLPQPLKIRHGQGKWLLRQLLYRYVPKALVDRPKAGFGVPVETWLTDPLRQWAEALLNEGRLKSEGFFNPAPVRKIWDAHLAGQGASQYRLWGVLMFQAWLEVNHPLPVADNQGLSCCLT